MQPIYALALVTSLSTQGTTRINATLPAEHLEVGSTYSIQLDVHFPEAVVASEAGAPKPFLQIDVPPSVKLSGRVLTEFSDLAANEFLAEPYERLLGGPQTKIDFELIAEPKAGETIGLNVVGYVDAGEGSEPYFLRRRLELPVVAGAKAKEAKAENSNWGIDEDLLQIGDKLTGFSLPQADGTMVSIDDMIGEKNLILTTYRAHW